MKTPHVHAELIKAWADGAEIESYFEPGRAWLHEKASAILWDAHRKYRLKPEPKPDRVVHWLVSATGVNAVAREWVGGTSFLSSPCNLKLTFDGETGALKSAEVLR